MPSDNGILVEPVMGVVSSPGVDHAKRVELRDAVRQNGPDMILEAVVVHLKIARRDRNVRVGGASDHVGLRTLGSAMHTGGVDGYDPR